MACDERETRPCRSTTGRVPGPIQAQEPSARPTQAAMMAPAPFCLSNPHQILQPAHSDFQTGTLSEPEPERAATSCHTTGLTVERRILSSNFTNISF